MKLGTMLDIRFKTGLAKLVSANIPLKVAVKLKSICQSIDAELKKFEDARQVALKTYGKLKKDGSLVVDDAGNVVFKNEEAAKAFYKELADLGESDVNIAKLKLNELGDDAVKVSVE